MINHNKVMSVERLSKTYLGGSHKVKALKHVSFDLFEGEMLAIMGTSGSGKSTLINILGTLDEPSEGKVIIKGTENKKMYEEPYATEFRRENIGFIFQSFNLLKDLSVEENIALPLILKGLREEEIKDMVQNMLLSIGLSEWKSHRPVQLSGGQQQRVAIGRALITSPPIILADEPTGNLDYNTSIDILSILVQMKRKYNQSIILVTHDPMVATYADRVLFFHDGDISDTYNCSGDRDIDHILNKFSKIMEKGK